MNAGSYNKEMKDIIIQTKCIDRNGKIKIFLNNEQELGYRKSIFQNNEYIILEVKLRLKKGNCEEIENVMENIMKQRKEKQPLEYPSAGSTFKRGNGFITAELIEKCGLKGYSIGGAKISEKHAGFVINTGNATAQDILDLVKYVTDIVYEKFGKKIELEVKILGEN